MKSYSMFVNGEAIAAADGRTGTISNPATEETIATVPLGGAEDVERAVAAADAAFEKWSETTPGERSATLL